MCHKQIYLLQNSPAIVSQLYCKNSTFKPSSYTITPKRDNQVRSEKKKHKKNKIPYKALYLPSYAMISLLVSIFV